MARLPRLYVPGLAQLITQRAIHGASLFGDDVDAQRYLADLREAARESRVAVHAYVLMPDHVHLLVTASDEAGTGNMMQRLGRRYVRAYNDRYGRRGTLWEGRYRATVLSADYVLPCHRFLELNPLRAGLANEAEHYAWSSCRHHFGLSPEPLLSDHALFWALGNTPFERQAQYRAMLSAGIGEAELKAIRYAAHSGWMLGELVASANSGELAPNRRTRPMAKGRPPKARVL